VSKSKSLKRVEDALLAAELHPEILHLAQGTKTAQAAADAAECLVDQIAKSIIFLGASSGRTVLFITAGGNRVEDGLASELAGEPLGKADAAVIREQTGFAIGGVSPIGHINPIRSFFDPCLLDFSVIWAAAGTPNHIFKVEPRTLLSITGATLADFT
jgi:prolyl-tRNA editing enzyme YbaK/EbsC (Cys-tRNA(Pro) deacylase)